MVFCPNCGTELREGAAFCPACGQAVAAPAGGDAAPPMRPADPFIGETPPPADDAPTADYTPPPEKKPGLSLKKLLPIIIAAVVIVAAGLVLILTLGRGGGSGGSGGGGGKSAAALSRREARTPLMDEDEAAWFVCSDGSGIKLDESDGIDEAYMTPDEKYIVVLTEEGDLYITDKSLKKKTKVEDEVGYIGFVGDKGFYYETEEDKVYRYSFKNGSAVKVVGDSDGIGGFALTDDNSGMLFNKDGKMYVLPPNGSEVTKIGSVEDNCTPLFLSGDGKTAIWAESPDGGEYTFYLWEGKDKQKLGKLECSYPVVSAAKDGKLLVLYGYGSDSMLLWKKGKEAVKVKIPGGWYTQVRTADGPLELSSSNVRELYICSEEVLYRVTLDGEKEKLASGVRNAAWSVCKGQLLWVKEDGSLRCGKLGKDGVTDDEKLAKDLGYCWFSSNGQYIYYIKDTDDDDRTLYAYKLGGKEPVKIDDDVYMVNLTFSDDTVLYFTDESGGTGDLKSWTWGGSSRKIADDVNIWTLESGSYYDLIDTKSFSFISDGDLFFWNGKEKKKIAGDIDFY